MATLLEELTKLTESLETNGIEYAVCGGLAMAIHGFVRATIDIDLLLLSDNLEDAWKIAENLGYEFAGLPLHFNNGAIEIRRISKIDREHKSLLTIDFLLVTDSLKEVWANRELIEWEEGKTWVVSREGLIYLKTISGRLQDLADIERLENEEN